MKSNGILESVDLETWLKLLCGSYLFFVSFVPLEQEEKEGFDRAPCSPSLTS